MQVEPTANGGLIRLDDDEIFYRHLNLENNPTVAVQAIELSQAGIAIHGIAQRGRRGPAYEVTVSSDVSEMYDNLFPGAVLDAVRNLRASVPA